MFALKKNFFFLFLFTSKLSWYNKVICFISVLLLLWADGNALITAPDLNSYDRRNHGVLVPKSSSPFDGDSSRAVASIDLGWFIGKHLLHNKHCIFNSINIELKCLVAG